MQNIFGIFRTDHSTEVLNKYLSFSWINQCIKLFINNSKFCHVANWMYYFICLLLWGALSLIRRNALPLCDQRIQSRNWILSQNSMDISLKLENDNGAYRIHLICLHDFIPDFQVVTISRVRIHVHHHVIIVTVECFQHKVKCSHQTTKCQNLVQHSRLSTIFQISFWKFFSYRCSFLCESFLSRLRGGWR